MLCEFKGGGGRCTPRTPPLNPPLVDMNAIQVGNNILMRTTDHGQATGNRYHLRLRVECTLFVIYKAGVNPRRIGDRLV
jgi:hypothetical protein